MSFYVKLIYVNILNRLCVSKDTRLMILNYLGSTYHQKLMKYIGKHQLNSFLFYRFHELTWLKYVMILYFAKNAAI